MSSNAYTPGPWDNKGKKIYVFGRGTIAVVPPPWDGGVLECFNNIRLIVAAPEMAEALAALVNIYDHVGGPLAVDPAVADARAVLAKINP